MAHTVQIWLSDMQQNTLNRWAKKNGFETSGKAAKALLIQALEEDKTQEKLDAWLEKIETHVARAASRGTHASLASLCLQTARADSGLAFKIDSLTAGEQFDWAWNMAAPLMKAGKPDYYGGAKHAHISNGLRTKESLELLRIAAEGNSLNLIGKIDEGDIVPWFEAMEVFRRTQKVMDEYNRSEKEWIDAYIEAQPAEKTLRCILEKMHITKENIQTLFVWDPFVFNNEQGWHEVTEDELDELGDRRVYQYSPLRDYNDEYAILYINDPGVCTWDDAREKGWI